MMQTVLPWFNLGNAAVSLGLATAATGAAVKHVGTARLEHLGGSLAELPTIRAQIARMGTTLAAQKAYLEVAANSVSSPDDTTLTHVLGVKASVNDAALTITESAMRVCGGPRSPSICPSNAPSATPGRVGDGANRRRALRLLRQGRHRAAAVLGGDMSTEPLVVGAVAYTPNVVPIWEGIRGYFQDSESPDTQMDFVLYSNYARLVDSLIAGHIDIAWNTNLAYVRTVLQTGGRCTPLAQRDTDVDYTTVFVAHAGSDLHGAKDIAGKRLALGSADSAHAAILPLYYLRRAGIAESDLQVIRFDTDIGKHGDTGRSELDAVDAVLAGEADVAAIGSSTWAAMGAAELMGESLTEVWRTDGYCHCMFTALDTLPAERYQPWLDRLLAMSWDDSEHRKILELEGLRRWVPPHLDGYKPLFEAVQEQGIDPRW
ncbi:hypothetical protein RN06_2070 [Mycobacterium tuberculosis variant bovis BCG]|nr:hypothetical protein RN06_2070 [Mycobacterium tuberculosis variant bovis BCG]